MTPTVDNYPADGRIEDAARALMAPTLSHDALSRIVARRASGECVVLPTSDPRRPPSRERWLSGALMFAAAAVIAAIGVRQRAAESFAVAESNLASLAFADSVCEAYASPVDPSAIRHLMVATFGVAIACGAEMVPSTPVEIDGSQIVPATLVYGSRTVTDGVFTSEHEPTTFSITRRNWHGVPALLATRDGPLITRVSVDSLTVTERNLIPLHWASWYLTQKPVGRMYAEFDSASISFVMTGRVDTAGRFPYAHAPGRLPWEWTRVLVIPALKLGVGWHGTIQLAAPYHPHVHSAFTQSWATVQLRVVGRESVKVPAGTYDCWKVLAGPADSPSFFWVSTRYHFVVKSGGDNRFNDTNFADSHYLERVTFAPSM